MQLGQAYRLRHDHDIIGRPDVFITRCAERLQSGRYCCDGANAIAHIT